MLQALLPFLVTCGIGLLIVLTTGWHGPVSMRRTLGVQNLHLDPTPRIGGMAIAVGLVIAFQVAQPPVRSLLGPMLLAACPAFAAGLLEDFTKSISVRVRLFATMSSGVLAWLLTGMAMQNTGLWGLDHLLAFLPLAVAFTAFVVGGVANAVNMIDGFNGLAAGAVTIMLAAMGLMAIQLGDPDVAALSLLIASVALGFGVVNWPWGKVFMGDGGAYLLGFLVAWVAILLPMRHSEISGWATLMACAYPVIEALFSIARRLKVPGRHLGLPDKRHLHHFLHRRVVRRFFPLAEPTLQNAMSGALVWFLALIPAVWAVANFHNTSALVAGFFLASFGYAALYARLTQFVWCFHPATLQRRSMKAS